MIIILLLCPYIHDHLPLADSSYFSKRRDDLCISAFVISLTAALSVTVGLVLPGCMPKGERVIQHRVVLESSVLAIIHTVSLILVSVYDIVCLVVRVLTLDALQFSLRREVLKSHSQRMLTM